MVISFCEPDLKFRSRCPFCESGVERPVPSLAPRHQDDDSATEGADGETRTLGSTSAVIPVLGHHTAPGVIVEQKYELVRLLGEGGMGAVWVARHLTLDVHVALKVMHGELGRQVPGAAERMLQEARAAACIGHPAIVQVFDFGRTQAGDPFISMELLHGESLAQALTRRGRLQPARALQVLLPIADALAVAHQRGIVHRDLKPDNVFLARLADGRVQPKILDFGIAKLESSIAPKLTQQGTVLGSPAYMAPEQAWGEADIDQRADVWAFCVMVYELLTGGTPFQGDSYNALLFAIARDEPKSIVELGVNEPELWALIEKGLAKPREGRFADMRELGQAFAGWLLARGVKTDITKAPLSPWIERRPVHGHEVSLFPSLSPGLHSSGPPAASNTTQIAGSPPPEPESAPPEARKPFLANSPLPPNPDADPERPRWGARPVEQHARRKRHQVRFSFPRSIRHLARAASLGTRKQDSRVAQFIGVALLSATVFVLAAYCQSGRARQASPEPATTSPHSAEEARTETQRTTSRDDAPPPPREIVLQLPATETEPSDGNAKGARRERPRPAPRVNPRKPPSTADLKNPFR
jgi:serine/threonine-protein kinase